MRKLLSILLLTILVLTSAAPAFAQGEADAGVPACCRGNGAHACMRMMHMPSAATEDATSHLAEFHAKCPCCPASIVSAHTNALDTPHPATTLIPIATHPAGSAQTECRRLIARDRSRQKRGPPTLLS